MIIKATLGAWLAVAMLSAAHPAAAAKAKVVEVDNRDVVERDLSTRAVAPPAAAVVEPLRELQPTPSTFETIPPPAVAPLPASPPAPIASPSASPSLAVGLAQEPPPAATPSSAPPAIDVKPFAGRTEAEVAVSPPVELAVSAPPLFVLRRGESLRENLARWCRDEGWTLVWRSDFDYPIQVNVDFPSTATFRSAVRDVLKAYWSKGHALEGRTYKNRVLEILEAK